MPSRLGRFESQAEGSRKMGKKQLMFRRTAGEPHPALTRATLDGLPIDQLSDVLSFLSHRDAACFSRTCRRYRELVRAAGVLWLRVVVARDSLGSAREHERRGKGEEERRARRTGAPLRPYPATLG